MNQVTEDANAQLEQLRRSFEEKVGLIKNNTEDELQEMADTAQKVLTEAGWDETGKQIVKGLTEGVQSEKSSFVDEITQLALAGVQAAKSTLDINSPSRVFREIGNYTGLGFVKGLQDYVDRSYAAGSEMAESAEGGLSGVLQTIADIVSGGFDMEPVIPSCSGPLCRIGRSRRLESIYSIHSERSALLGRLPLHLRHSAVEAARQPFPLTMTMLWLNSARFAVRWLRCWNAWRSCVLC